MTEIIVTEKRCIDCSETKPADAFWKDRGRKDGLHQYCKKCANRRNVERRERVVIRPAEKLCGDCNKVKPSSEFHKNCSKTDGLSARCVACSVHARRLTRYGLTAAEFAKMEARQQGRCAICLRDPKIVSKVGFVVDHCHATGKVRGLLCHSCNVLAGLAWDSPERVRALLAYLLKHQQLYLVS